MNDASVPLRAAPGSALAALSRDQHWVLLALVLGWSSRPRAWVMAALVAFDARDAQGRRHSADAVQVLLRGLAQAGWIVDVPTRLGHWQVLRERRSEVYLCAIASHGLPVLRRVLTTLIRFDDSRPATWLQFGDTDSAAALVRLELFAGVPWAEVLRLKAHCRYSVPWEDVQRLALMEDLDPPLFARLEPALRQRLLEMQWVRLLDDWIEPTLPLPS